MKKSESIAKIAAALVKFNSEVGRIAKDAKNPHFKSNYATLDKLIDETRPLLASHGLSILQFATGDENGNTTVSTMLLHESGEWIESEPLVIKPVADKNGVVTPHAVGSAITYGKRYQYGAILSLSTGVDDDGNAASFSGGQYARQPQHVTQDVSHATYSEHEQIPGLDGHVVEIPEQEAPPIIKQLWQIKHGSLDKLHDHFNKQLKLGYSAKNIEANLRKEIKLPQSIADVWFDMYSGDQKMLNHGPAWYLEKRLEGMTDDEIEVKLAQAIAQKQTAAGK